MQMTRLRSTTPAVWTALFGAMVLVSFAITPMVIAASGSVQATRTQLQERHLFNAPASETDKVAGPASATVGLGAYFDR